jgi:chromosome partitioning protein
MRRLALVNQKGGCGKTTTAVNLAASLASVKHSVLLIDLDPQGHSTLALGGICRGRRGKSVFDLLYGEEADDLGIDQVAFPVYAHLDLVPSDITLSTAEQRLASLPGREERLRRKIEALTRPYEFIIIDCPPNLGILTVNALLAVKEVIVPVDPGIYSLQGLIALERTLGVLRDRLGHRLERRILPTQVDRRIKYHRRFIETLRDRYPDQTSQVAIRRSVKVTEAATRGRPVLGTASTSGIAEDFKRLAAEVLAQDFEQLAPEFRLRPARSKRVRFRLERPGARAVSVAGSFNNWRANVTFLKGPDEKGSWRASVKLPAGEYEYRFIVDGEWLPDPVNPEFVLSPFGGRNSLVRVDIPRREEPERKKTHPGPQAAEPRREEAREYRG